MQAKNHNKTELLIRLGLFALHHRLMATQFLGSVGMSDEYVSLAIALRYAI